MNFLENDKARWTIISLLGVLQIASFTIVPKEYSMDLFVVINFSYFLFGFLSLDWKQAIKNIVSVTIPVFFFMVLLFFMPSLIKGKMINLFWPFEAAFQIWGLTLIVGLPIFLFGFGFRYVVLLIKKSQDFTPGL